MYAKPTLLPLDLDVPQALCCEIRVNDIIVRTPACGTPVCTVVARIFETCSANIQTGSITQGLLP